VSPLRRAQGQCGRASTPYGPCAGCFLIRLCDLVGAPRGRFGPFFCLPGRGEHLGGPATKWGGRGRESRPTGGHAAVPPAVPRWPCFTPSRAAGAVSPQGGTRRDKWLDRAAGAACPSWARKNQGLYPSLCSTLVYELHRILGKMEVKWPFFFH
jgi:hypothetical protein